VDEYSTARQAVGQDSLFVIVTCYGLDGPGIESLWGQDFSAPVQTSIRVNTIMTLLFEVGQVFTFISCIFLVLGLGMAFLFLNF